MTTPWHDTSACRLCGRPIGWVRKLDGRRKPFDLEPDGSLSNTSHFLTCTVYRQRCADRDAAARRKREAEEERRQGRLF
ncbi:MAG: hypothetical protein IKO01_09210 [Kiritimatiellae bacterium]|nr:hypothetical protein [Kiritimatiellia bacterium]